jgi:glycosyltransferase involved in cell wall biosynthesis
MKILYLHQYFNTPEKGGSLRSYHLARSMVAAGHQVEMITAWNQPHYQLIQVQGIQVHYLPVYYGNHLGTASRLLAFLSYAMKAYLLGRKLKGIQHCYASSTPLTVGFIALLFKWLHSIPYTFEVRDLWPLAPIQMGYVPWKVLHPLLYALEKMIYRGASAVIALSPAMAEWVHKKVPGQFVLMLPNMCDCQFFQPTAPYQPPQPFVISYIGTLGKANHLQAFLTLACCFQEKKLSEVQFRIMGKGRQESLLKKMAAAWKLTNLDFMEPGNTQQVKALLDQSQAVYISFAPFEVLETTSPNKFFDGLAAGKLIITNTRGWIKDLVEEHECGFYTPYFQPETAFENLLPYLENPLKLAQSQANARKLAESCFDKDILCQPLLAYLKKKESFRKGIR